MLFDFSKKKHVLSYTPPAKKASPKEKKTPQTRALALDKVDRLVIETKDALDRPNALSHIPVKDAQLAVMIDGDTKCYKNSVSLYDQLVAHKNTRNTRKIQ
jgi:hypothetical protein